MTYIVLLNQSTINEQFHPVYWLLRLFFNDAHLWNEIWWRSCPARSTVIGPGWSSCCQSLSAENISCSSFRQFFDPFDDLEGKTFCPFFEVVLAQIRFVSRHAVLCTPHFSQKGFGCPFRIPKSALRTSSVQLALLGLQRLFPDYYLFFRRCEGGIRLLRFLQFGA